MLLLYIANVLSELTLIKKKGVFCIREELLGNNGGDSSICLC